MVLTPGRNFLCRCIGKELERKDLPLRPPLGTGYGRCKQLFTLFFVLYMKLTQSTPRSTPRATLMHILFIIRLKHPPIRSLTAGVRTAGPHGALRTCSHRADHTRNNNKNNSPLNLAAGGHWAQEHARLGELRLRLRPGGRHGCSRCARWRVGAPGGACRAQTGPDRC